MAPFDTGRTDSRRDFLFLGEALWLDFVNTEIIAQGERVECLASFADWLRWLCRAEVIPVSQTRQLLTRYSKPERAQVALNTVRKLRSALRSLAENLSQHGTVSSTTLIAINFYLRRARRNRELVKKGTGFELRSRFSPHRAPDLLSPVAESVSSWLCEADFSLLKKCQNPNCILFFYDTTRNHSRRWCSMEACGNREKSAAYYARKTRQRRS